MEKRRAVRRTCRCLLNVTLEGALYKVTVVAGHTGAGAEQSMLLWALNATLTLLIGQLLAKH